MFTCKGVRSELELTKENRRDFFKIVNFLFTKYGIDTLHCQIVLNNKQKPEYNILTKEIKLSPTDNNLRYYEQLDFQFAHELTHAIQYYQKRGLKIKVRFINGGFEQEPYPNHSFQETEAVANSIWIMEKVLKYTSYNARIKDNPDYYDYETAFSLVNNGEIEKIWNSNKKVIYNTSDGL